ncbi:MAG: heme exporter protein CcmB [Actinomycetota bacterium]
MAIAAKDLRSEVRAKEIAPPMILFALTLMFLLTFVLPPTSARAPIPEPRAGALATREIAAALLWASLLFAAVLGFGRSAASEREGGRMEALLLTPADPAALFAGKALASFAYLWMLEAVLVPAFVLFLDVSPGALFPGLAPVLLAANAGLATAGTLFAAASQEARGRELILPLLLFPVVLPMVLGAIRLTTALLMRGSFAGEARWFILILAFDLALAAIGAVAYEEVVTE